MIANFKEFLENIIIEELHPELQDVIKKQTPQYMMSNKKTEIVKKIKDLTSRGEKTGLEGNMPQGSSRAYLLHEEPHQIHVDGKPASIKIGTKVAIRAQLDKFHQKHKYDGLSLGAMQNKAEGGDWHTNSYRILLEDHQNPGHFHTNHDTGIFPPLIDHDDHNHEYTQVGHSRDLKAGEFQELTRTPEHPRGITHREFCNTLNRFHERNLGKYWANTPEKERRMDKVETHPLVQKFMEYHGNTGHPPYDYQQRKNMGVFEHPNGTKHIVSRDHGFDGSVSNAYMDARKRAWGGGSPLY